MSNLQLPYMSTLSSRLDAMQGACDYLNDGFGYGYGTTDPRHMTGGRCVGSFIPETWEEKFRGNTDAADAKDWYSVSEMTCTYTVYNIIPPTTGYRHVTSFTSPGRTTYSGINFVLSVPIGFGDYTGSLCPQNFADDLYGGNECWAMKRGVWRFTVTEFSMPTSGGAPHPSFDAILYIYAAPHRERINTSGSIDNITGFGSGSIKQSITSFNGGWNPVNVSFDPFDVDLRTCALWNLRFMAYNLRTSPVLGSGVEILHVKIEAELIS